MTEESTTPDLEDVLRRSLEAVNRRDFDAAFSLYAPDVCLSSAAGPTAATPSSKHELGSYRSGETRESRCLTTYEDLDKARAAAERLAQERR